MQIVNGLLLTKAAPPALVHVGSIVTRCMQLEKLYNTESKNEIIGGFAGHLEKMKKDKCEI